MNNKEELQRRVAWLESRLDQVEAELAYLHTLLTECGFPEGITTLKMTIEELLAEAKRPFRMPFEENPPQSF